MIEDNLDELIAQIEDTIGGYSEDLDKELAVYISDLQNHMRGGEFKNQSGDLRRSMHVKLVDDYTIQLSMVYYGYFLAFGVDIRRQTGKKTFGVVSEVANALNVARRGRQIASDGTWRFGQASKSKRVFGIDARGTFTPTEDASSQSFYPDNVIDKLMELLTKYNKL